MTPKRDRVGSGRGSRLVSYRIEAPAEQWDRLVAELHALGTLGVEELPGASPPSLLAYFDGASPHRAVRDLEDPARGVRVGSSQSVPDVDWTRQWRLGLSPRRVGPLWIRPSWCESAGSPELLIDPERSFGSGEHPTTRLALRLLLGELRSGETLLDLGTGSGILALGALRMGARWAVGVDIDPVACGGAQANARRNRLRLPLACGTLETLRCTARFELVVANLLSRRLRPWLPRLATHAQRRLILSGYLEEEWNPLQADLSRLGLRVVRAISEGDAGDVWGACVLTHVSDLQ